MKLWISWSFMNLIFYDIDDSWCMREFCLMHTQVTRESSFIFCTCDAELVEKYVENWITDLERWYLSSGTFCSLDSSCMKSWSSPMSVSFSDELILRLTSIREEAGLVPFLTYYFIKTSILEWCSHGGISSVMHHGSFVTCLCLDGQ